MGTCRFETAKTKVFERSKGPKSQKKVMFGTSFALGNERAAVELSTCRLLLICTVVFDRFFVASLEPMARVEAEEAE